MGILPKNARKWNEEDRINGVWWFKTQRKEDKSAMPDLLRRDGIIVRVTLLFVR